MDENGEVDVVDFSDLSANFGRDAASYAEGNIDLITGVTQVDFLLLSDNFGKTPGVAAVPEPTGFVLAWLCLLGIVAVRRRRRR